MGEDRRNHTFRREGDLEVHDTLLILKKDMEIAKEQRDSYKEDFAKVNSILEDIKKTQVEFSKSFDAHVIEEMALQADVHRLLEYEPAAQTAKELGTDTIKKNHQFVEKLMAREERKIKFWESIRQKLIEKGLFLGVSAIVLLILSGVGSDIIDLLKEIVSKNS